MVTTPRPRASGKRMEQTAATEAVRSGVAEGTPVRRLAEITGWSVGWVSELAKEFRGQSDPATRTAVDELDVLQECIEALSGLDGSARHRILRYLGDRFGAA
ncbi:hypothetical protein [Streptomyces albidoflavus]|uniref:hypothetical protein n=1 Tax=Streptomyces albidoflavus TaxID=1886 RepID=UPI00311F17D4